MDAKAPAGIALHTGKRHVCIIGAGVVGAATAYVLSRAGHRVTVLEALAGPGLVTSFANGAQLSYNYVEPLATPATLRKLPQLLLDPESPLRFRFTGQWAQIRWGLQFIAACRASQVERATRALLGLAFLSRDELDAARAAEHMQFDFAQRGKLVLYSGAEGLAAAARQVAFQRELGCQQEVLDAAACFEREPALRAYRQHVHGGVWTPGEAVGDALALSRQLMALAQAGGAELRYQTPVESLVVRNDRVDAVETRAGSVSADVFVLANGCQAAALARTAGLSLPVYPIKGYSITLPIINEAAAPQVSVTDLRRKTVYARLNGSIRVAGMAEIVGHDLRVDAARIRFLARCMDETFPGAVDADADPRPWAGLRPATPTSMPILGPAKYANLLLNVGHGPLGLTMAMGSARVLERHLAQQPPAFAADFRSGA
jgi:D-amino-acid dehydrogenase